MPFDLSSPPKAPPKQQTRTSTSARPKATGPPLSKRAAERTETIKGISQIASFICMVSGNLADAGAIAEHEPRITPVLVRTAEKSDRFANFLDKSNDVGPYGELIVVMLPFVAQLLANHKVIKPHAGASLGVVPPEALESGVKASMAKAQADALQEQREYEKLFAQLEAESSAESTT